MSRQRWRLEVTAQTELMLGSSRAKGFHTPTFAYIPGGTLRGALAGAWIREWGQPAGSEARRFQAEVIDALVGPATAVGADLVPLDHLVCKYKPKPGCAAVAVRQSAVPPSGCPSCGGRLEGAKGGWINVGRQRTTRTALTDLETAAESQLFSRDGLARSQVFRAVALGDLRWLSDVDTIWVGGRRSVGGRATVQAVLEPPTPPEVSGDTLTVRLESPGIFLDEFGANRPRPTPGDLAAAFGGTVPEVVGSWVRSEMVGGWNAAGGLPKSADLAAVAGSVFELRFPRPVTSADALAVEESGIGVRRADGFGWVSTRPWAPRSRGVQPDHQDNGDGGSAAVELANRAAAFDDKAFVKRILGWVRAGYEVAEVSGAAAFTDLTPEARGTVERALELRGEKRQQLIIALEVRS